MFIKQLSVFIENRKGRLEDVAGALEEERINIISLSLADTNEYGILRLIVNNPEQALAALRGRGFSATLADILAVRVPNKSGELHKLLRTLAAGDLNVEYMYILDSDETNGSIAVKVSDAEKARAMVERGDISVMTVGEVDFRAGGLNE